ncbi:MAG: aminoacyl-tRNA hydrolase [Planctomycetota bacterium]|nr:MAG: aminoacyl-tRNA hydrolase [Planctomycetota bacterium]
MRRPETKMVVGLGNPGRSYINTRHNAGFRVIDSIAKALAIEVRKRRFGARLGEGGFAGKKLILLKPIRFMNCSGQVVATAAGFYRLDLGDLLVISDDMALEPGRIRLRAKGSAGGHNGLVDVIEKLGSEGVNRLRVGIGPCGEEDAVDYVLDRPTKAQKALLGKATESARDAALCWIEDGIETAMNRFNMV